MAPYMTDDCQLVANSGHRRLRLADINTCIDVSYLGRTPGSATGASLSPVHGFGIPYKQNSCQPGINLVFVAPYKYSSTTTTVLLLLLPVYNAKEVSNQSVLIVHCATAIKCFRILLRTLLVTSEKAFSNFIRVRIIALGFWWGTGKMWTCGRRTCGPADK